ncbi:hypothetical protein ACRQEF_07230 [Actinotignum sp. GS-2025a]|uniref:hypothetical protein n=1 Tax=Actinotignum sp. GS-2025a TaxID=3427274 RepID=UPI003F47A3C6
MAGTVMKRRGARGARGVGGVSGASDGRVAMLVRLCVLGMVAGVLVGMALGALVPTVNKAPADPVRGEDSGYGDGAVPGEDAAPGEGAVPGDRSVPGERPVSSAGADLASEPDAVAVARQLVAARDAAISAGDIAALSALSVPEGEAAAADAKLRSVLENTPVAHVETEVREAFWVGENLLEVVTVQRSLVLASGETIGPQPERCARWQLSPQPWRIVAVHPCP